MDNESVIFGAEAAGFCVVRLALGANHLPMQYRFQILIAIHSPKNNEINTKITFFIGPPQASSMTKDQFISVNRNTNYFLEMLNEGGLK
jgi:hypothetical protein